MKKTKNKIFEIKLDEEEQAISNFLDNSKLESVSDIEKEIAFAREAAANYLRKDARLTLRLSSLDLDRLKQKAAYKGLPYQTFIASVLHEYAAGHFTEAG